jgi:hypothetical protein
MWRGLLAFCVLSLSFSVGSKALAQAATLELSFTPIDRAQIGVWVEREDGTFMGTLALTYATAKLGIGNRPGALQMNSGFRWPYGRREGVLPVWATRRASAPGAKQWKRVIFQNRTWEGYASRSSDDMSPDSYYCLSFSSEQSKKQALDAVTCASVFSSDKGRYITDADVTKGYGEPYEDQPGNGRIRKLGLNSLYPPRRDVDRCTQPNTCYDHADVADFRSHALAVMPELDAVTRATLQGNRPTTWTFTLPAEWPKSDRYKLFVEVNVEGDYNASYDDKTYPTPRTPSEAWDTWAQTYGYAYRGQPSVVYAMPFGLATSANEVTLDPLGFGSLHGEDGTISPMTKSITDDPVGKRGSGADRLLVTDSARLKLRVSVPDSAYCQVTAAPAAVQSLQVVPDSNKRFAHMWAHLSFRAPESQRPIGSYQVEVKADDDVEWEPAFTPDSEQMLLPVALDVCADPDAPGVNRCEGMAAGTTIDATLSGLKQSTHYQVRVTARDRTCGESGAPALADITTPERSFSTVTPCFVASAAYGSPLAGEIGTLRMLRDRHLATNAVGRQLIALYYSIGPALAEPVREHEWLAGAVRAILGPLVKFTAWWMD